MTVKTFTDALRSHADGPTIFAGLDEGVNFEPWNGARAEWPRARIVCRTVDQVSTAVKIASDHGVTVSVAGGRSDVFARNSRSGQLVVDLREMNRAERTSYDWVSVSGGTTTSQLLASLPAGVVTPTVTNLNVGVIGAAAGGGYGLLSGSFGLACDALLSADVILADGRLVHADQDENTDLFWALRGGGTGFGVVVNARFATYPCASVFSANVAVQLRDAHASLLAIQSLLDEHSVRLGCLPLFVKDADAEPVLIISLVWNGPEVEGQSILAQILDTSKGVVISSGMIPYRETVGDGAFFKWGEAWTCETGTIARLDSNVATSLIDLVADMPLPDATVFLHGFHGRATSVPINETAFQLRRDHFVVAAAARWDNGDSVSAIQQQNWARKLIERLDPFGLPGGYVNFLSPLDTRRVRAFYGPACSRLEEIKRQCDPYGIFGAATGQLIREDLDY